MKKLSVLLLLPLMLFGENLISPIPQNVKYDYAKAKLGKKLFSDTRLSHDDTVSCATCHNLTTGGDDNMQYSFGIEGQKGQMNAPTVLNAMFNFAQFWDGRAKNLQDQAQGPIHNPIEMGSGFGEVVLKLNKDQEYVKNFKKIYGKKISGELVTDAIAEFEKALYTPNSRFDKYLRGDKEALTKEELHGYRLFKNYGCVSCHNGVNLGSNLYQKFGVMKNYEDEFGKKGRFNVTEKEDDKYYFKVPTLRNIELTAPYFHDGSAQTLKRAIEVMIEYQLGRIVDEKDIDAIESFLLTLTGEPPKILEEK